MEVQHINFKFKPRNRMLDWKKIGLIDIDKLMNKPDLTILEDNLENVTFCNVQKEFDLHHTDPNFIKIFLLSQLVIEYLLHSNEYLLEKLKTNIDVIETLEKSQSQHTMIVNGLKDELNRFKLESHNRKKIIITQQKMMTFGPESYFKCLHCDMAFLNKSLYKKHMMKRHPDKLNDLNIGNSKLSEQLEQLKVEIKELKMKMENEVHNGERLKIELNHKDSELKEKFEKMKLNYEIELNRIQQYGSRLISEANLKQKQSEKTISILLNKQKSQESIQSESKDKSEHVLQLEIRSLKAWNTKLENELLNIKRLHEREIEQMKEYQDNVSNKKKTCNKISKENKQNEENERTKVKEEEEEEFEQIVKENVIHTMKFKTPHHMNGMEQIEKLINTKSNTKHMKENNPLNKKFMDSQSNINNTKHNEKQDNIQINVNKYDGSDENKTEKVNNINNKGINTDNDVINTMDKKLEVARITDKLEGQNNQFNGEQLTSIKQDIENEIRFILKRSGVEDPQKMNQESCKNVSKILSFERQKLAKNYHGFESIREEVEHYLEEFMQQIIGSHVMHAGHGNQLTISEFPINELLAMMDGNSIEAHPIRYPPIYLPPNDRSSINVDANGIQKSFLPLNQETQSSTSMLPKNMNCEIYELDETSSMTEITEDKSPIDNQRKTPSLGSEILSIVSSVVTDDNDNNL